ncbi:ABC transporter permease [Eisenbergiella porci]|uniref:ABC transporter permease n=1 Tax=Eisenbergiella porci TaxID=2652274 RepID=UPI002A83DFE6|nr:ABC transporter permease [Eisenbergiella porci]
MNIAKRAYLYLFRKTGKTLSLLAFLLVMATMMLTCISIQSATQDASANVRKALRGSFTVNAKLLENGLTEDVLQQILSLNGLSGAHTLRSYTQVDFYDSLGNVLEIETEGAASVPEGYEHAGKLVANSNSESDTYFTEAGFELTEGAPITAEQENVVLLHEDFARRNNLSIGDTLMLGSIGNTTRRMEATVQGIFTHTREQNAIGVAPSYDLYENVVFTDILTGSYLIFGTDGRNCQYGDFFVYDPETLVEVIAAVKEIPGVAWDDCVITKYDKDYQNAKAALEALQNIVFVAMGIIMVVCFIVLSLLLIFRIRNRVHEMGVLLAMGISKKAIVMQQLFEVLTIAALALLLSFATSSYVAQQVGNSLLSQTTGAKYEVVNLAGHEAQDNAVMDEIETPPDMSLPEIDVSITAADYLAVWCVGILLCTVSTILAMIPVLRMEPKKVLSQMS